MKKNDEFYHLLKKAEVHDQGLYSFSVKQSPRKLIRNKSSIDNRSPRKTTPINEYSQSSQNVQLVPTSESPLKDLIDLIPKSDSSSTIKPLFPKNKMESIDIDIESKRLASTRTSSSNRVEESDLSDFQEENMNESFDDPHDTTYQPDMLHLVANRQVFQEIPVPAEPTAIYKSFFEYLEGPDKFQKAATGIVSEVRRIGIIIRAERVDDLLNEKKIRDDYLGFCIQKGYKPAAIMKYLRSLNDFYDFLIVRSPKLPLFNISNENIIRLQKRVEAWSGKYKKPARERFWERQMEDYKILVDDKQIEIYCQSSHAKEASVLFREFNDKSRRITLKEFCILRDNLFVIIELGNAHRSGVCANMTMSEFKSREFEDGYWMIYVMKHKNFYVSGHAVVTLTSDEMLRLEIFVSKVRVQTKPKVNNVFVSWTGSLMASGAVSTQLCSLWRKTGILKKTDKNLCCNILRKSASTGV